MKKYLCTFFILIIFTFILTGCAALVSTETSTVSVQIVEVSGEEYQSPSMKAAFLMPPITGPQDRIVVKYEDLLYVFQDEDTCKKYSDKLGEYVNGILETKKYIDGTIKSKIIVLE